MLDDMISIIHEKVLSNKLTRLKEYFKKDKQYFYYKFNNRI